MDKFPAVFFKGRKKESGELNSTFTKTLPGAISGVVAAMMKKQGESRAKLTSGMIERFTNAYMDRWYVTSVGGLINESLISPRGKNKDGFIDPTADHDSPWTEDELIRSKWMKAAGIKGY
jgi:hypothetical protein